MPRRAAVFVAVAAAFALAACANGEPPVGPDGARRDAASSDVASPSDVPAADAPPTPGRCADGDRDGDGYGTGPSCMARDCDDANAAVFPGATEACNNLDDDCDGMVDDGFLTSRCGVGACAREVPNCLNGRPAACTPGMPMAMEVCNGLDDDCDGMIDEDIMGATSCGVGACRRSAGCGGDAGAACTPGTPSAETCNRMDDDCDGTVDNGFRAAAVNTTYTALATAHGGCTAGSRIGPDCNAAMHRFCAGRGCSTSGFGPLENSGDVAVVGCVAAEPSRDVPYATLAMHHAPCNGTAERIGPNCNAAIHRYCASMGYASGFGPVELGPSSATVTCLRPGAATVVNTTYTALRGHHAGCDGAAERIGPQCNAAISRFCAAMGRATGYGPVENSGDVAAVVCVAP